MTSPAVLTAIKEALSALKLCLPPASDTAVATKTMLLKSKKNELVLVTALAEAKTDMKEIQRISGTKDLRMAPLPILQEAFGGISQAVLSPLALVHQKEAQGVTLLIDERLLTLGSNAAMKMCVLDEAQPVALTVPQLLAYLEFLHYPHKPVSFAAAAAAAGSGAAPAPKHADPAPKKAAAPVAAPPASGETLLGMQNKKFQNFSAWYTEVVTKAEMIEYYDVSGCYIMRPWSFFVWKQIQRFFGDAIERMGVEDCYFPMFVSKTCLEKEKDHVEGFAPEVAWVTKAGETDLEVPIAIRPTSETVMYPYYAKWVRSHRDLPVRMNMWNSVIRWEFSHPTPFIRTREFLWQEGHCAWASYEDCEKEVLLILDWYAKIYEELLAVPVVKGEKTEKERFAGGHHTTTVETYIEAAGRGCQGGTSHNLGQNFGKMFKIGFQDPTNSEQTLVPWQNSWGLSTRTIGVMVMVHGDDTGLVMPPRVASVQVVIIPVGITSRTSAETREALLESCRRLESELNAGGVRAKADLRDNYSPGWRFNHWEVKGVPIRVECGPRELEKKELAVTIRHNGEKRTMKWTGSIAADMQASLNEIHDAMLNKARVARDAHRARLTQWEGFTAALNRGDIILAPWCGAMACEDQVKKDSAEESRLAAAQEVAEDAKAPSMGAKTLCIPHEQPEKSTLEGLTCICKDCNKPAAKWVLFGRSF